MASKSFQLTATNNLISQYRTLLLMNQIMYISLFYQILCIYIFFVQLTRTNNSLLKVNQTLLTLKTI